LAAVLTAGLWLAPAVAQPRDPQSKIIYLTFDDGPDGLNDPRLLKILKRNRVPATFFLLGSAVARDPGAPGRLWLAGHAVGNHTYSHTDLTTLGLAAIEHEMTSTQRLLGRVGGACVRPPYGAVNPTVYAAARDLGLRPVMWSVDPEDWAHQDTQYIVDHILTHVRDRSTVLMHDGGGPRRATLNAVKQLIPQLRAKGYEFRTVPACRVPMKERADSMAKQVRPAPTPTPTPTPPASASPTPSSAATP
jgi:peptidoglycan/xylan/chitin deacetylase (PgdA/CDA1 family)